MIARYKLIGAITNREDRKGRPDSRPGLASIVLSIARRLAGSVRRQHNGSQHCSEESEFLPEFFIALFQRF
jgi:hypothetical protein